MAPDNRTVNNVLDLEADDLQPPNTMIFDGERSAAGYRLNRFTYSLKHADNRKAFKTDPDAYMALFGLADDERSLIQQRDWLGLVKAGANIYALVKLTGVLGTNLVQAGLQMRGEDLESFRRSRPQPDVDDNRKGR